MALGESRAWLEEVMERELSREGEGALDKTQAQRLAKAVAATIEQNNLKAELQIRQILQIAGIKV
jgi:hypothetical protein